MVLRTSLSSLLVLAAGAGGLAAATDGFRAFTSETARRLEIRERPRAVPDVPLQAADGRIVRLGGMRGRWLLVDFIYTRCPTLCTVQGSEFAQLQRSLGGSIRSGSVALLSVSFDPTHDDPARLAAYLRRSGDDGTGWIAARPTDQAGLRALLRAFGVVAIPDGRGGYVHNSATAVVSPGGRLVALLDWDDPGAATDYVTERLAP